MDIAQKVGQLCDNASVINHLLSGVIYDQMRWKPAPDRWSLLEVTNHLLDEEREDFRAAIRIIFSNPEHPWPSIDPMGWVSARSYNSKDPGDSLHDFLKERDDSLAWLKLLASPDWNTLHSGNGFGGAKMRAGDVIVSWVAHDYFHIRQITNLKWEYLTETSKPFSAGYAGSYS